MGRLRFGVAFAVTGKELDSCLRRNDDIRRLPRRGEETEEGKLGGCKGKLSGIRHSGQSESQQDRRRSGCQRANGKKHWKQYIGIVGTEAKIN